jgi:hypothetical protein
MSRIQGELRPRRMRIDGKEDIAMWRALAELDDGKKAVPAH